MTYSYLLAKLGLPHHTMLPSSESESQHVLPLKHMNHHWKAEEQLKNVGTLKKKTLTVYSVTSAYRGLH